MMRVNRKVLRATRKPFAWLSRQSFLHSASRLLYTLLTCLSLPYIVWRLVRRHDGWRQVPWREYWGHCALPPNRQRGLIWLHAVSVGEAAAAAELIRQLQEEGYQLLLTHTTPAGGQWLREKHPAAIVTALPLDVPSMVRYFIRQCQPNLGIILEAEYWPNLLLVAKQEGVQLMLANARLGARNAYWYRYAGGLMHCCARSFDVVAAQTARDAGRLRCYGAKRVITAGNLKFDLPLPVLTGCRLHHKPTILIAATRDGEEEKLLSAMSHQFWQEYFVILAPRHPSRSDDIMALLTQQRIAYVTRSRGEAPTENDQLYLADTLGEMGKWYAACDVALIGGSFLPYGGQNPIEAMALGVAAVIGPHVDNYTHLVHRAVAAGALVQVSGVAEAITQLCSLASADRTAMQTAAINFCDHERGALEKHLQAVRQLLT